MKGSEKCLFALAFNLVRCSILRFILSKYILSDSFGQQFFIVQSFLTFPRSIRPGGKSRRGPRNSVILSHSCSNIRFLIVMWYGSYEFISTLIGPSLSQGLPLCA